MLEWDRRNEHPFLVERALVHQVEEAEDVYLGLHC